MCGIAGIVGLADSRIAKETIIKMNDCQKHRGPDASGVFVQNKIALGHRRLSIIDLSEASNQPFTDYSDRYVLIFNGEIYNYLDIKDEFRDYPFKTDSDTEVLLAAYDKYGVDCLAMLNGMFAFALWDKLEQTLFIARDRLGVKPLYYSLTPNGQLIFASEIRAILESELVPKEISEQGVHDYTMYQSVYSPHTIVKDIFQIEAGEFAFFRNSELTKRKYWNLENHQTENLHSEKEIKSNVRKLLFESIERRMISDVPLGAFLSGGIDSSAIVAIMSEISSNRINTFSVNFAEKEFDESIYAELIAKKYNTKHTSVELSPRDFLDELPNALTTIDSPSGDGINTYVVAKATKNAGITVALSGLGGDELFAGYSYFSNWFKIKQGLLPKAPKFLRSLPGIAFSRSNNSKYQRMAKIMQAENINIAELYPIFRQVLSPEKVKGLLPTNGFEPEIHKILNRKLTKIEKLPLLSQFSIGELLGYTHNVLLKDTDQFSMASALEVREPFFDYKLVEYVLTIPDEYKFPKYPKSLLVESIAPLLPDEIVHRKKMGFVLPWENWMRNELREFCEDRIKNLAERNIFDSDKLLSQWNRFLEKKNGVIWSHLWHLVILTEWLENNKF